MRKSNLALIVLTCCLGAWTGGCGDDDSGAAPSISNLTHDATTLSLGEQGLILGSFDFTDPEGDGDLMQIDITMPDGQAGVVPDTVLTGVAGLTAGTINWNLSLTPTQAGTYDFSIRMVDEQGNVSNELLGSFDAQ